MPETFKCLTETPQRYADFVKRHSEVKQQQVRSSSASGRTVSWSRQMLRVICHGCAVSSDPDKRLGGTKLLNSYGKF